jgi:hypothetical protein
MRNFAGVVVERVLDGGREAVLRHTPLTGTRILKDDLVFLGRGRRIGIDVQVERKARTFLSTVRKELVVDGDACELTGDPPWTTVPLSHGTHAITMAAEGFKPVHQQDVTITDEVTYPLVFTLEPKDAAVQIVLDPVSAAARLDSGETIYRSGDTIAVPPFQPFTITVTAVRAEPVVETLRAMLPGQSATNTFALTRILTGTVEIGAKLENERARICLTLARKAVRLDGGAPFEFSSFPYRISGVTAGVHRLEFAIEKFNVVPPGERNVVVDDRTTSQINLTLVPAPAKVLISSSAGAADVSYRGNRYRDSVVCLNVPSCEDLRFQVTAMGYGTETYDLSLDPGEARHIFARLQRAAPPPQPSQHDEPPPASPPPARPAPSEEPSKRDKGHRVIPLG